MSSAMVDFPLDEARAILKSLGPDGVSMTAAECQQVERGRARLQQAVDVEAGAGGSAASGPTVEEVAAELVGEKVRVESILGTRVGTLTEIRDATVVSIEQHGFRSQLPLASITSVKPEQEKAAA
jgi:hypothetical protein